MKKRHFAAALLAGCILCTIPAAFADTAGTAVNASYADAAKKIPFGTDYNIMVRLSGKLITASANGNIEQWESRGDTSQAWRIVDAGGGFVAFLSAADLTQAITVESGDSTNGSNFALAAYTGADSQRFRLNRTDDAYYITAKCSGNAAMDVYDISYENGANIDQWDYWGGEGQKFYIRPTDGAYTFTVADLDFDGILTAKDLTLHKRGMLYGFDNIMSDIARCEDLAYSYVPGQSAPQIPVRAEDTKALRDYLLTERDALYFGNMTHSIPYDEGEPIAYLFAYFLGNAPEQERLSYAISRDGYHFTALNGGKAVWQSSVGTGCIRDPYLFKGEDGLWHLLATDMKSSLGWSSNRNLISAKSTDLVHWFDESLIEIADKYPNMQGCDRAWAPQAIYDPAEESYMIYFAARVPGTDDRTIMYYAYSKDLRTLDTAPKLLFAPANGDDAIDSDIIYENGLYYMYYKNETNKRIYLATAENASGPYKEIKQVSEGSLGVEGPNIYRINGTNEWLMMSDAYGNGYYVMQKTSDLETFTTVSRSDYSFDFTPRHGYVIPITQEQYTALTGAFGGGKLGTNPYNTGMENVTVRTGSGTVNLPKTVTAQYSDGGTMELPVEWNEDDIAALKGAAAGRYTVRGTVSAADYGNPLIEERADPFVTDGGDGYFYFTASYPAYGSVNKGYDRIVLRRSNTIAGLAAAEEKTIWQAHDSGIMAKHIWAPEMHRIGGAWYMFFAAGSSSDIWAIRPYVLRCDGDPYTDTWTECGQMQATAGDTASFTSFSLDMTYFENNGKHYVIWAEIKGDSSLFMAEINPDEPWKLISAPILLTKPDYDWEKVNHRVNEGAAVLKSGGKVYVFFSASGTGSEYCVGRMEADADADLMDIKSWKKHSSPVLSSADVPGESGPGHNSFVTDENGNLLIVYHARPSAHDSKSCGTYADDPLYDPCRHTRIRQIYVDANGIPNVAMTASELLNPQYRTVTATVYVN